MGRNGVGVYKGLEFDIIADVSYSAFSRSASQPTQGCRLEGRTLHRMESIVMSFDKRNWPEILTRVARYVLAAVFLTSGLAKLHSPSQFHVFVSSIAVFSSADFSVVLYGVLVVEFALAALILHPLTAKCAAISSFVVLSLFSLIFEVLLGDTSFARAFGISGVPETILVRHDGVVAGVWTGVLGDEHLDAIANLLMGSGSFSKYLNHKQINGGQS